MKKIVIAMMLPVLSQYIFAQNQNWCVQNNTPDATVSAITVICGNLNNVGPNSKQCISGLPFFCTGKWSIPVTGIHPNCYPSINIQGPNSTIMINGSNGNYSCTSN